MHIPCGFLTKLSLSLMLGYVLSVGVRDGRLSEPSTLESSLFLLNNVVDFFMNRMIKIRNRAVAPPAAPPIISFWLVGGFPEAECWGVFGPMGLGVAVVSEKEKN